MVPGRSLLLKNWRGVGFHCTFPTLEQAVNNRKRPETYLHGSLMRRRLVRDYCCAKCHASLKEQRTIEGEWVVVCVDHEDHKGFHFRDAVIIREEKDAMQYGTLARAYPDISGYEPPSKDEIKQAIDDLFGEE